MPLQQTQADEVQVGDTVQVNNWPKPATVKSIHIVFHMDNNMDLVVPATDSLYVVKE